MSVSLPIIEAVFNNVGVCCSAGRAGILPVKSAANARPVLRQVRRALQTVSSFCNRNGDPPEALPYFGSTVLRWPSWPVDFPLGETNDMKPFHQSLLLRLIDVAALTAASGQAVANEIRVAVASNCAEAMRCSRRFEADSALTITLTSGSAETIKCRSEKALHSMRFSPPTFFGQNFWKRKAWPCRTVGSPAPGGKLVLWSPKKNHVDASADVLKDGKFRFLSIAPLKLAPYGAAAQEVLEKRGLWDGFSQRPVRGQDSGQTFQFVKSGNADLGFVALSRLKQPDQPKTGNGTWFKPRELRLRPSKEHCLVDLENAREANSKTKHPTLAQNRLSGLARPGRRCSRASLRSKFH